MKNILSRNIARYRRENKLTQEQLAERLGITFQAVSKWETGQTVPETPLLIQLAKALNISMDKLFGYTALNADVSGYDEVYRNENYFWGVRPSAMCLKVLALLPPDGKPLKLLDIGCGEGKDAVFFARCGYDVSAFDISDAGIEKTKRLADSANVHVNAFKANLLDYRLEEDFDVLYSSGVLAFIKPSMRNEIMKNYKAHVSYGGMAAFQALVKKPFIEEPPDKQPIEHFWKSGELFTHFHDWYIEHCAEHVFDCNSWGIAHQHAANQLFARKIKRL